MAMEDERILSRQPLKHLQEYMNREQVSFYLIFTSDYHQSEYVSAYFQERAYISGFTGSAGTLLVSLTDAWLWTDGRYFIQAEQQLQGSGIALMRMGEEGVPTLEQFLEEQLQSGQKVMVDGRMISAQTGRRLSELCTAKQAQLISDRSLIDKIWSDRPALPDGNIDVLDICYAGESVEQKLKKVREMIAQRQADAFLLTALEDIAWLFNLRGSDVSYTPVFLSYVYLTQKEIHLFVDCNKLSAEAKSSLCACGVQLHPYDDAERFLKRLGTAAVFFDEQHVNYALYGCMPHMRLVSGQNPTAILKAIKNEVEIQNLKIAHIKDGIACTKFMYWLKHLRDVSSVDEYEAACKIDAFRREQEHFLMQSFETISAYGAHAAMMHYSAVSDSCAKLDPHGMLLVDSGGQYLEGTTDITRTFAVGNVTEEMKRDFTLVLKGMLRLAGARFLYGCTGQNLDILARAALWQRGIDYKCGTGHGVGYLLSVHEGPNAIRWKSSEQKQAVFEEGMVTTDEPGIYLEGRYGIRIENELLCRRSVKNEYGQFMEFETLTLAPIDLELVDPDLMDQWEIDRLNADHVRVREMLTPFLNEEERTWLCHVTRAV